MSSNANTAVRLGLIGAGRWGRNYIKTIRMLPGVRLSVLASRNPASQALVDSSCRITPDWRELVDSQLVDGVIIATPPDLHAEMLETTIRARIPAMIEKPLTLNLPDALKLQLLQREFNALVLVDHTQLFNSAYIELRQQALSLGPIRVVHSEAGNWGPFRDYTALWDYGPHDLALILHLLRKFPREVSLAELESRPVENGLGGAYRIDLAFTDGVRADVAISNLRQSKLRRLTVVFDSQTLVFEDLAGGTLTRHDKATTATTPIALDNKLPLTRAVETFIGGISGQTSEHFGLDLAVEIARVLDRSLRS